jgi:hypothetical protein
MEIITLANAMTRSYKGLPWKGKTYRNLGTIFIILGIL